MKTIKLTEDTVYENTLVVKENTTIEGNGFKLEFKGHPLIDISNATLKFNNVVIIDKAGVFLDYINNYGANIKVDKSVVNLISNPVKVILDV